MFIFFFNLFLVKKYLFLNFNSISIFNFNSENKIYQENLNMNIIIISHIIFHL
jgi:hypothetical protein